MHVLHSDLLLLVVCYCLSVFTVVPAYASPPRLLQDTAVPRAHLANDALSARHYALTVLKARNVAAEVCFLTLLL